MWKSHLLLTLTMLRTALFSRVICNFWCRPSRCNVYPVTIQFSVNIWWNICCLYDLTIQFNGISPIRTMRRKLATPWSQLWHIKNCQSFLDMVLWRNLKMKFRSWLQMSIMDREMVRLQNTCGIYMQCYESVIMIGLQACAFPLFCTVNKRSCAVWLLLTRHTTS